MGATSLVYLSQLLRRGWKTYTLTDYHWRQMATFFVKIDWKFDTNEYGNLSCSLQLKLPILKFSNTLVVHIVLRYIYIYRCSNTTRENARFSYSTVARLFRHGFLFHLQYTIFSIYPPLPLVILDTIVFVLLVVHLLPVGEAVSVIFPGLSPPMLVRLRLAAIVPVAVLLERVLSATPR